MIRGVFLTLIIACSAFAESGQASAQRVQWASELISFSTEHSRKASSAAQVLGEPDVWPGFGPSDVAWAMYRPSSAIDEFVRVRFAEPMKVRQVAVAETLNPGAIFRIILFDTQGGKHTIYENRNNEQVGFYPGARLFSVVLDELSHYDVQELRLVLRTSRVPGMSQIDAIAISDSPEPIRPDIHMIQDELFDEAAENLGPAVNSAYADVLPMISPDGRTLYFARKLHPDNVGEDGRDDIWFSELDAEGRWSPARSIGSPLNNEHHNFVSWIRPDGKQMLLPHDYLRKEWGSEFRVSFSHFDGVAWSFPRSIDIVDLYNKNEFTCVHMNTQGTVMLLALEREEGLGGLDLYVSFLGEGQRWSTPKSLGPTINTAGMEGSVFLAADDRSLYFASNGHPGFGGYDMFLSRRIDDSWTNWSRPLNLGSRINSERDEYYYTLPASGDYAYFSSDRGGYGAADIFRIRLPKSGRPDPVSLIQARMLSQDSGQPLDAATLTFRETRMDIKAEDAGRTALIAVQDSLPRGLVAEAPGYFPVLIPLDREPLWFADTGEEAEPGQEVEPGQEAEPGREAKPGQEVEVGQEAEPGREAKPGQEVEPDQELRPVTEPVPLLADLGQQAEDLAEPSSPADTYEEIQTDIRLVPLEEGRLILLKGVYFPANKSTLLLASRSELDVVADFLMAHPRLVVEVGGHTNSYPPEQFCLELSTQRARAVVAYLLDRGVLQSQLTWNGYGKSMPVADNSTYEGRKLNQRVELKILESGN